MAIYREYLKDGLLSLEGDKDASGNKVGTWKEYDRHGNLVTEENYMKGKRHGLYKTYHDNGKVWCSGWFKHGEKNGEFKIYDKAGKLSRTQIYFKDQLFSDYMHYKSQS